MTGYENTLFKQLMIFASWYHTLMMATLQFDSAIKINYPGTGNNSQFAYDASNQLVGIVETASNGTSHSVQFILTQGIKQIVDPSSSSINQLFDFGQTIGSLNYFYTRDHLGSIRELTDSTGGVQTQYQYSPYGQRMPLVASVNSDVGYAGLYLDQPSGLNFAAFRAYSPLLGRWLNRDPIAERGGINLYAYVQNEPFRHRDPNGTDTLALPSPGPTLPIPFPGLGNASQIGILFALSEQNFQILLKALQTSSKYRKRDKCQEKALKALKNCDKQYKIPKGCQNTDPNSAADILAYQKQDCYRNAIQDYADCIEQVESSMLSEIIQELLQDAKDMFGPWFLK